MKEFKIGLTFAITVAVLVFTASFILYSRLTKVWDEKYGANVAVTKMFDQDGCTAFTFDDQGTKQYFVKCRCGAEIKWSNGKVGVVACTQVADPKQDLREQPQLVMPAPPTKKK